MNVTLKEFELSRLKRKLKLHHSGLHWEWRVLV